jgi:hypothetical protein
VGLRERALTEMAARGVVEDDPWTTDRCHA